MLENSKYNIQQHEHDNAYLQQFPYKRFILIFLFFIRSFGHERICKQTMMTHRYENDVIAPVEMGNYRRSTEFWNTVIG